MKVDLHVHSKHSDHPSIWVLRKLGCPESFTDPKTIYKIQKSLGMTHVTITDHNSISGALSIAHLDDTFISEEVSVFFPEDKCHIHVCTHDINERQHEDIQKVRFNVYDFVEYINKEGIRHHLAHPTFAVNDRLKMWHLEQMLLLFKVFELNGTRDDFQNQIIKDVLDGITPADIDRLANKHDMKPVGKDPHKKVMVGGSDDHSSLHTGSKYTHVPGAKNLDEFFDGILEGKAKVEGVAASPKTMAHNFYSIAYQYYRDKHKLEKFVKHDSFFQFLDNMMFNSASIDKVSDPSAFKKTFDGILKSSFPFSFLKANSKSLPGIIKKEAMGIISDDPLFSKKTFQSTSTEKTEGWHQFASRVSNRLLSNWSDSFLEKLSNANIFEIFNSVGSLGTYYFMMAPYFIAYKVFTKDRDMTVRFGEKFNKSATSTPAGRMKIAHFTDTFSDMNGVARTLNQQAMIAKRRNVPLEIISCTKNQVRPFLKNFDPIGEFKIPEYDDFTLYYPPLLELLDYCYENKFTHIHSATPGPVGLVALAISKIIGLPIYGTYHTAFPSYALHLTNDTQMEDLVWKAMVWYYNQMDVVYAPSLASKDELIERGVRESKVRFYERGIDVDRFHPSNASHILETKWGIKDKLTILYVGRVSKEKNLQMLKPILTEVQKESSNVHMIIVGDGPYREELASELKGLPVTFAGFLDGEDLESVYASSDIFLFPSTTDTFGNVVLEAQASGLPALVSDKGGPQENVIDGKTGYVCKADEVRDYVRNIRHLQNQPALLKRLKKSARTYMENRSFESAFLKLWDDYKQPIPKEPVA